MAGSKVSQIKTLCISHKDKPANRYKRICQVPYGTFLAGLQNDSDEEIILKLGAKITLPVKAGASFSNFIIKHRNTKGIEEVKRVLEKDTLLLDLIPIAFDDDLDIQLQLNLLFTEKENTLSTIWDFILISFRRCTSGLAQKSVGYFSETG